MPYTTHADLAEHPGALELAQVASDAHERPVKAELLDALLRGADTSAWQPQEVAAGQRALARVDAAVADADAVIDGYLAKRGYALPLPPPVHRLVASWSRAIARYQLHKDRLVADGKDPIERAWRDALRLLAEVAAGRFALGAGDAVAVNKTEARFEGAPPVFGRHGPQGARW